MAVVGEPIGASDRAIRIPWNRGNGPYPNSDWDPSGASVAAAKMETTLADRLSARSCISRSLKFCGKLIELSLVSAAFSGGASLGKFSKRHKIIMTVS
jgi:hypothetical protein